MKAMRFGNSSAFLCITKTGAMPSMPLRSDVDAFNNKYFDGAMWEKLEFNVMFWFMIIKITEINYLYKIIYARYYFI